MVGAYCLIKLINTTRSIISRLKRIRSALAAPIDHKLKTRKAINKMIYTQWHAKVWQMPGARVNLDVNLVLGVNKRKRSPKFRSPYLIT